MKNHPKFSPLIVGVAMLLCLTCFESHSAIAATACAKPIDHKKLLGQTAAELPENYLESYEQSLSCLLPALKEFADLVLAKRTQASTEYKTSELLNAEQLTLISLIRSISRIFEEHGADAVTYFRQHPKADHSVIRLLAWGARSNDYRSRLYATLVLGNVLDNTDVCIVIDELHDSKLFDLSSENAGVINGRANLLATIAVVSPWAYKENCIAIEHITRDADTQLIGKKKTLPKTFLIIEKIRERLRGNLKAKLYSIPAKLKDSCALSEFIYMRGVRNVWKNKADFTPVPPSACAPPITDNVNRND